MSVSAYTCAFCGTAGSGEALSCAACGSPVDVQRAVSMSGWEELAAIPDLARLQVGRSTCQIEGALAPVADFTLAPEDSLYFAHHVLLWMDTEVRLEILPLTGFRRFLAGMPVAMTLARGPGRVAFSISPNRALSIDSSTSQTAAISTLAILLYARM